MSFDLHALVARLDRSADEILRAELGISYRRFLALFMVGELGATTQRSLAERLDVSEPSVSRMTAVLDEAGLLAASSHPDGGNRRRLRLTTSGEETVARSIVLLEHGFTDLLERSGIPAEDYARHTRLLLAALDPTEATSSRATVAVSAGSHAR